MQNFTSNTNNDKLSDTVVSIELSKVIKELLIDLNHSFNDITSDIIQKYKPYQSILEIDDFDNIHPDNIKEIQLILIHCKNIFPKRFFDILYQNESMFEDENIDTQFLPNIEFKHIYFDTTSSKTKETIWKYLQLILFTIITDVDNKNIFGNNEKLFEAINTDEFKNKLEDTVNELNNLFTKQPSNNNDSNNSPNNNDSNNSPNNNDSNNTPNNNDSNTDPTNLFANIFNNLKENMDLSNNDTNNIFNKLLNDISSNELPNFPDLKNIFDNIDLSNNNPENFKEIFENMQNMFSNINQDTSNNSNTNNDTNNDDNNKFKNIFENMPKPDEIHNHINSLINGKIGLLAKELAEETANELNIDETNVNNVNDVFNQMFKNPTKLMSLVNNITTKIDKKMKDGSIKESELLEEATSLFKNMGDVPGMNNFNDLLKTMNMDKFMPKGGKFNNNAFQNMMDQNIKMTKMKERMRKKADNKNNMPYSNNYNETKNTSNSKEIPVDLNDLTNNLQKAMSDNNSFIQNILKQQQQNPENINNNLDNSNMQGEKKNRKKNKHKKK